MKDGLSFKSTDLTNDFLFIKFSALKFGLEILRIFGFIQCFVVTYKPSYIRVLLFYFVFPENNRGLFIRVQLSNLITVTAWDSFT